MTLPHDFTEDEGHRFYQTLNEDILLKPNKWNEWDMQFQEGDVVNVTGHDSLHNAICIAIMTRYQELKHNQLYSDFGCRIHELIKANKSEMVKYKIELFVQDVLRSMRRVRKINWIEITEKYSEPYNYTVTWSVNSISDETIEGEVSI